MHLPFLPKTQLPCMWEPKDCTSSDSTPYNTQPPPTNHPPGCLSRSVGSQRSYITQRAAKALSLEPEGVLKTSIFTFGSSEKTLSDCERVRVAMVLHLLAVPVICEPLAAQPLALCLESYEHLSNLELADSTSDNSAMEVDLLVVRPLLGACHWENMSWE